MSFILKYSPAFFRKLDTHLRINHTWLWATKIHIHVFLALVLGAFFSLIGLIYFADVQHVPGKHSVNGFFALLFVPAALFTLLMLYNMSLFNTDKSGAYRFPYQEFFQFGIYFITFCLPLLIIVPPTLILNERIANLVDDRQFEIDKKAFNEGDIFFPRMNYEQYHYFPNDHIYLEETRPKRVINEHYNEDDYITEAVIDVDYIARPSDEEDSARREMLYQWERMRDSIFWHRGAFINARPKLYFQQSRMWSRARYYDPYDRHTESLDEMQLRDSMHRMYLNNINITKDPALAAKNIAAVSIALKKYYRKIEINERHVLNDFLNNNYSHGSLNSEFIRIAFEVAHRNVENIQDAKLRHITAWNYWFYNGIGIFIFVLSILFYIFKNVHWKQFLLAIALSALIITVISVIEAVSRFNGEFISVMGVLLPIVFLVCSVKGFKITKFSWIHNQMNIMLNAVLPFFPVIVLFYLSSYHQIFEIEYFDKFKEYYTTASGEQAWRYTQAYYTEVSRIWGITYWAGIFLYVFIWNSYLKILYLRYWFLPKVK